MSAAVPSQLDLTQVTAAHSPRQRNWEPALLAGVVLLYALLLFRNYSPAISEPDDNGYFAQGSLLFTTGHTWFTPQSDAQYIGMHWLLTPDGHYISRYPPGLAVVIGAVYSLAGYKAATLVNPGLSILALIGSYLLARRLALSVAWALAAVALIAANPTFIHHALAGDSHMGVTCVLAWGLYLLMRWSQQRRIWQAFAAGAVLGCIPTIRYPDGIMAAGFALFMLAQWRDFPRFRRHLIAAAAGVAVPIVPLLIRNQLLLGAFWRTGYALTNEQTGFSWEYFRSHALQYIQQVHSGGLGLMFALGIIGITYMICLKPWRDVGIMFALLTIPMLLLYMAYYWAPQMSAATMRFLLPTFPPFILAGVWLLAEVTNRAPRAARIAVPIVLLLVQGLWATTDISNTTERLHRSTQQLAAITQALDETAGRGDVVIANSQILQHLDFVRHWNLADTSALRGGFGGRGGGAGPGGGRRGNDPNAPSPMQSAKRDASQSRYSGSTEDREQKFADDILNWAGDHKIYLVGTEAEVRRMLGNAARPREIKIIKRIPLPEQPPPQARNDNPFGGGMQGGGGMPGGGMQGGGGPGGGFGGGGFGGGGFNGGGFNGARQGGFGNRGGGFFNGGGQGGGPPGGGGGGGPFGPAFAADAKEAVIAEWDPS